MLALRLLRLPDGHAPVAAARAIDENGLTIGRSPDCHVVLEDPLRGVSRQHAWLAPRGTDAALVRCISATAPLTLNGLAVPPGAERLAKAGDLLRIGGFELRVEDDDLTTIPVVARAPALSQAARSAAQPATAVSPRAAPGDATPGAPPRAGALPAPVAGPDAPPAATALRASDAALDRVRDAQIDIPLGALPDDPAARIDAGLDLELPEAAAAPSDAPGRIRGHVADPPAFTNSRLDAWFDLDSAPDPLGPDSPLPTLAGTLAPGGDPARTVIPPLRANAPAAPPSHEATVLNFRPPAVPQATRPTAAPTAAPAAATSSVTTARPPAQAFAPPAPHAAPRAEPVVASAEPAAAAVASTPGRPSAPAASDRAATPVASADLATLRRAFLQGAGLADTASTRALEVDPFWMAHLGALLRASTDGTLAQLRSRSHAKRGLRVEGTRIAEQQNNPLKFVPDAGEALALLLRAHGPDGYLAPVEALHDAHADLLAHQRAMDAGMRAALAELAAQLGPAAIEQADGPPRGLARWFAVLRDARRWRRHCARHAELAAQLDTTADAIVGRAFARAYEEQTRQPAADAQAPSAPPRDR